MGEKVYFLAGIGVIATIVFLLVRVKRGGVKGIIAKTVASLFFVATASAAIIESGNVLFGILVIMGLVFGLVGDIFLDLKVVYSNDSDQWLFAGMSSFTSGHILYLAATYFVMPLPGENFVSFMVIPALIALAFAIAILLIAPFLKLHYGKFTIPTFLYAFLLSFWVFVTGSVAITAGYTALWIMLFAGATLFIISDLIL
ncbi:MAG TPA: lysoplasmalogenase family protein, partial [Bacteroidales bacterium]|nr:lysoplasmalogenase family protein [Bacteroidales bacterium]